MQKQPEMTQKPIDPAADLNRGFSISTPAAGTAASDSAEGTSTITGDDAAAGSSKVDPLEVSRQEKLGLLVVQLGGASEEKVFGSSAGATMAAFRERRVPDLLVINRREDDAAAHPFVWYKPWTWARSGQQVSPMRWSPGPKSAPPTPAGAQTEAATQTTEAGEAQAMDESVLVKVANAAANERKKRRKSGPPPVVMTPLTEDQVQHSLTEQVREDRDKLLKSEERIHKVLQGIEDTRYKYLVPSQDLSCEKQVLDVVVCYQKRNAEAEKKRAAILQKRKEEIAKGFSNQIDEEDLDTPIVLFDALACGPKVDALKKCTEKMVASYSEGELK